MRTPEGIADKAMKLTGFLCKDRCRPDEVWCGCRDNIWPIVAAIRTAQADARAAALEEAAAERQLIGANRKSQSDQSVVGKAF